MVQPLAFAELLAGGVLLTAAYTGQSPAQVVKGEPATGQPQKNEETVEGAVKAVRGEEGNVTGYVNPFKHAEVQEERTDQGVDFSGKGPITALGEGIITKAGQAAGWPGDYLAYTLTQGARAGQSIYLAEGFQPTVSVGQRVLAGQQIGEFVPSSTGIETGFAQGAAGSYEPLAKAEPGGYTEGQVTRAGHEFADFLQGILHNLVGVGGVG